MAGNTMSARNGPLYWAGMTLLALWNVGGLVLAIYGRQQYNSCMVEDGFNLCFDFTGPLLVVLFTVDAVVAVITALVHWFRACRARPLG
jgi:hypothetical protein